MTPQIGSAELSGGSVTSGGGSNPPDPPSNTALCCVHECRTDGQFTDSGRVIASLTAGGVAGVVSWIPAVPFDVVKSLVQVSTALLAGGRISDRTWV